MRPTPDPTTQACTGASMEDRRANGRRAGEGGGSKLSKTSPCPLFYRSVKSRRRKGAPRAPLRPVETCCTRAMGARASSECLCVPRKHAARGLWAQGRPQSAFASAYFFEIPHASFLGPDGLGMPAVGPAGPDHDRKAPKCGTAHETTCGDAKRKRHE